MMFKPSFDPEVLKKIETTITKVGAYLDRAGALQWWQEWLAEAKKNIASLVPRAMEGT